jgi:hypothetical protein
VGAVLCLCVCGIGVCVRLCVCVCVCEKGGNKGVGAVLCFMGVWYGCVWGGEGRGVYFDTGTDGAWIER